MKKVITKYLTRILKNLIDIIKPADDKYTN